MHSFNSGHIATAVEGNKVVTRLSDEIVSLEEPAILATLTLNEDEAVEYATLILLQVTKIRAARLEHHGLDYPYGE